MSPLTGALIALTFMLINFSLGMTIAYKTIKKGIKHKA